MSLNSTVGDAAAESYFAIAEADTYFSNRGVTTWTGATAVKEAAARRATAYLDNQYRGRWKGITVTQTQALAWPRAEGYRDIYRQFTYPLQDPEGFAILSTVVPQQVKTAAMEAALLALTGSTLEPTLARGGQIKSIGKSVGPLRKDITYTDGASVVDRYLVIEGLLRGLVTSTPGSSSGNTKLVRA
jgi:hypothetical protein